MLGESTKSQSHQVGDHYNDFRLPGSYPGLLTIIRDGPQSYIYRISVFTLVHHRTFTILANVNLKIIGKIIFQSFETLSKLVKFRIWYSDKASCIMSSTYTFLTLFYFTALS